MGRFLVILGLTGCLAMAACAGEPEPAELPDAGSGADAAPMAACTGAAYDLCQDTTSSSDCSDGAQCRAFGTGGGGGGTMVTLCAPSCDSQTPCPDQNGTPITCNMMGRCRAQVPNACMLE